MALEGDPLRRESKSQNMTKTQLAFIPSLCFLRLNSEEKQGIDISQE